MENFLEGGGSVLYLASDGSCSFLCVVRQFWTVPANNSYRFLFNSNNKRK